MTDPSIELDENDLINWEVESREKHKYAPDYARRDKNRILILISAYRKIQERLKGAEAILKWYASPPKELLKDLLIESKDIWDEGRVARDYFHKYQKRCEDD